MTACRAPGVIIIGGKRVGQVRCGLEAGHDRRRVESVGQGDLLAPWLATVRTIEPTPHAVTLEWLDPMELPDLALFDPNETFDAVVEIPTGGDCRVGWCLLEGGHDGPHDDVVGPV